MCDDQVGLVLRSRRSRSSSILHLVLQRNKLTTTRIIDSAAAAPQPTEVLWKLTLLVLLMCLGIEALAGHVIGHAGGVHADHGHLACSRATSKPIKTMPVHRRTDTISIERSGGTGHVHTCTAFCQRSCLVAADDGSRAQSLHSCKLANQHFLVDLRKRRQSTLQQPTWHAVACGSLCLCDQHARAPAMSWVAHACQRPDLIQSTLQIEAAGSPNIRSTLEGHGRVISAIAILNRSSLAPHKSS